MARVYGQWACPTALANGPARSGPSTRKSRLLSNVRSRPQQTSSGTLPPEALLSTASQRVGDQACPAFEIALSGSIGFVFRNEFLVSSNSATPRVAGPGIRLVQRGHTERADPHLEHNL